MTPDQKNRFAEALKAKFEKGKLSHPDQVWESGNIDYIQEIQDESLDLWWYADLIPNPDLKSTIKILTEELWMRMDKERGSGTM